MLGLPSTNWALAQNVYYKSINSRCNAKPWLTVLIKKLWEVSWDMWDFWNHVLHSKEKGLHIRTQKEDLIQQINTIRNSHIFTHIIGQRFEQQLHSLDNLSIIQLKSICSTLTTISSQPASGNIIRQQQFLRAWLHPTQHD